MHILFEMSRVEQLDRFIEHSSVDELSVGVGVPVYHSVTDVVTHRNSTGVPFVFATRNTHTLGLDRR